MNPSQIFLEMLQYPNSPRVYRDLKDLYFKLGKGYESKAFNYLLEVKFKELNNDYDINSHKKQ